MRIIRGESHKMRVINLVTILFLSILAIKEVQCNSTTENGIKDDNAVYKQYIKMDKDLKSLIKSAMKSMIPYALQASERVKMSSKCTNQLFQLMSDLRNLKLSAIEFLDATAKLPEGFLMGRSYLVGDFQECLQATTRLRNGSVAFKGQYCVVALKPILPRMKESQTIFNTDEEFLNATRSVSEFMKFFISNLKSFYFGDFEIGLCLPSGCNSHDIKELMDYVAEMLDVHTSVKYCDYEGKFEVFTPRTILAICILALLGTLALIGTIVDYYCRKKKISIKCLGTKILHSFSILTNFPKLVNTSVSGDTLTCLPGIRALSLFHIILLHEYSLMGQAKMIAHLEKTYETINSFFFHIIINGLLTIEVFFFVGGLVNCYIRMKNYQKSKKAENPIQLLLHRLLRIYPGLILAVFVFPYIFNQAYGPRRVPEKVFLGSCDTNWWTNMVFVNNFFDQRHNACMPHTWYIAADFHLFVISLFTIPVLFKHPKRGILVHLGLVFVGILSASIWARYKDFWPAALVIRPIEEEFNKYWNGYCTTFPHIAPYFIGVIVGYFLHMNKELKISKPTQVIGWIFASGLFISMLFMPTAWNQGTKYTVLEGIIYFAFSRPVYVLGVAWMVICCATGHGGIINYLLSLKIWIPIARISYMTYLLSPALQLFYGASLRVVHDHQNMIFIWRHFGDLMASLLLSLVMVLIAESPFAAIEKLVFRKKEIINTDENGLGKDNPVFISNYDSENVLCNNFKNIADSEKL